MVIALVGVALGGGLGWIAGAKSAQRRAAEIARFEATCAQQEFEARLPRIIENALDDSREAATKALRAVVREVR